MGTAWDSVKSRFILGGGGALFEEIKGKSFHLLSLTGAFDLRNQLAHFCGVVVLMHHTRHWLISSSQCGTNGLANPPER